MTQEEFERKVEAAKQAQIERDYGEQCADTDGLASTGAGMNSVHDNAIIAQWASDHGLAMSEDPGREAIVTDSEKAADQMRQDILGGKIDKAGRQVVRDACDKMDAPKAGRDAANDALGRISGRGGFW